MMTGAFERLLERYGQTVELCAVGESRGAVVKAFLQPVLERREDWRQALPTPLGVIRKDQFLYLGPPGAPIDGLGEGFLLCHGTRYDIQTAQAVYVGDALSHWWGVLKVRDEE